MCALTCRKLVTYQGQSVRVSRKISTEVVVWELSVLVLGQSLVCGLLDMVEWSILLVSLTLCSLDLVVPAFWIYEGIRSTDSHLLDRSG